MELVNYCFDTRYADIMSSRSGLYPREAFHRLASPQTSFGVRSSRIHFSPTDGFSYERVAQFNVEWIFSKLDSGFQSLVGFRILSAGFRIPKPRIPDSTQFREKLNTPTDNEQLLQLKRMSKSPHSNPLLRDLAL